MYRAIYQELINWKQRSDRKPLILRGARQVGKTTILKTFMLADEKGFPVGKVNFLDLHPMCFSEFLCALNEVKLKTYLDDINTLTSLPEIIHNKLMSIFKTYSFVGGMPEAIAKYVESENFTSVREIHNAILDTYNIDFSKHAPKTDIMKISEIWHCIPSQLAKENKKFLYSHIKTGARGRQYENALQWLIDAGLVQKVINTSTPKIPLSGYAELNAFKLYLLDIGLLAAMAEISPKLLLEGDKMFQHYNGTFIENHVATSLKPSFRQLHYWTSSGRAELDFIIQQENRIVPIEVKSGFSRQKKSLRVYMEKYNPDLAVVISPANLKFDGKILNCPFYFTNNLLRLLSMKPSSR